MTIQILGSASGVPVLTRSHAAVLARAGGDSVLIDAGEGVSRAFVREGVPWSLPRAVYLSHTHSDHVAGLPMLLQAMHLGGRVEPLSLHVPPGRVRWFRDWLHGLYIFEEKWRFPVAIRNLDVPREQAELEISALRNSHLDGVGALARAHGVAADAFSFLLYDGSHKVLVSADINRIADLQPAIAEAALLIVDATHVPQEELGQLTRTYPGLEILATHIPPELEAQASAAYTRAENGFRYAADGMLLHIDQEIRYD